MLVITVPSAKSNRFSILPCFELLWTNILSEMARTWPLTEAVVETITYSVQVLLLVFTYKSAAKTIYIVKIELHTPNVY